MGFMCANVIHTKVLRAKNVVWSPQAHQPKKKIYCLDYADKILYLMVQSGYKITVKRKIGTLDIKHLWQKACYKHV